MSSKIILIPIYKSFPDPNEKMSFNQCITILKKHRICIVSHNDLDISYYTDLLISASADFTVKYFDRSFFENLTGYNKLMLSFDFYHSFKEYDYMLIYQLDAWVFRDEFDYWCEKEYDYIGAPWFENHGSFEEGNKHWVAGNGGFSLRRIPSFINLFKNKIRFDKVELMKIHPPEKLLIKKIKRKILIWIQSLGLKKDLQYFTEKYANNNEDTFWVHFFQKKERKLKIANFNESIRFSFEQSPNYLFELNKQQLPFGCHAWEKYEYDSFWSKYIITTKH